MNVPEYYPFSAPTHPASSIISFSVVRESSPSFGQANPFFLLRQGPGVLVLVAAAPRGVCFPRPPAAAASVFGVLGPVRREGEVGSDLRFPISQGEEGGLGSKFPASFLPFLRPFLVFLLFFSAPLPFIFTSGPPFSSSSSTLSSLRRNKAKKRIGDDDVAKSCPCVTPQSEWLSKEIIVCRARKKRQQGGNCEKIVRSTLTCCSSVQSTLVHRREQSPRKETRKKFVMLRSFYSSLGAAEIH